MERHTIRSLQATGLAIFASVVSGHAFPPGPGTQVHGYIRDEFGWLVEGKEAYVVFSSGGEEIKRTAIDRETTGYRDNYRIQLPVDMNPETSPYKESAVKQGDLLTVHVEMGGEKYLPIEVHTGSAVAAKAGAVMRLDFTLGSDIDGDGLPDEWELWQLKEAGFDPNKLDTPLKWLERDGDIDGDSVSNYLEYLSGTNAYFSDDFVHLNIDKLDEDGWVALSFRPVEGKTYQLEVSTELGHWERVSFGVGEDRIALQGTLLLEDTAFESVRVSVPPPGSKKPHRFFRLSVR